MRQNEKAGIAGDPGLFTLAMQEYQPIGTVRVKGQT